MHGPTASYDKTAWLWNVAGRYPIGQPLIGHTGRVLGVAVSPDGRTVATCSADKTTRLWDMVRPY